MGKIKTKTPIIELNYTNIKGQGIEKRSGKGYEYKVTALIKKGSKTDKEMQKLQDSLIKQLAPELGLDPEDLEYFFYKPYVKPDPNSKRNKKGKKIKDWIDTDYNIFIAKTGTELPSGNKKIVKVYDGAGNDMTEDYQNSVSYIDKGSKGIVFFTADVYDVEGNAGITAYLDKVQVTKLKEGDSGQPVKEVEDYEEIAFGSNKILDKEKKKKKKKKKKKGKKDD